uniref:Uncharacterized protein n=1 Tax=Arundo donax TaxID=35708 RepID=A0A0A9DS26_ARUDO
MKSLLVQVFLKTTLKQVFRDNSRSRGKACLHPWLHLKTQLACFLSYKSSTKHNARI